MKLLTPITRLSKSDLNTIFQSITGTGTNHSILVGQRDQVQVKSFSYQISIRLMCARMGVEATTSLFPRDELLTFLLFLLASCLFSGCTEVGLLL